MTKLDNVSAEYLRNLVLKEFTEIWRFFFRKIFSKNIFRKMFFEKLFSKNIFRSLLFFHHFKKFAPEGQNFWNGVPCLAPRGGLGGLAPQESPLITRALPPQRPCLAPVPCPQFLFVQIFSSKFVSSEFFRPNFFRPNFFRPNFFVQFFTSNRQPKKR